MNVLHIECRFLEQDQPHIGGLQWGLSHPPVEEVVVQDARTHPELEILGECLVL